MRAPNPTALDDQEWSEFLYFRMNPKGPHAERWRHVHGCGRFFNVVRDTTNDVILASYQIGEPRPKLDELAQKGRG